MIAQLQDIIPALTGFFFGLIVLVYFVFKKNSLGMVISSISCVFLMFIFEIISVNFDKINSFLKIYQNILNFPLVTILASTLSSVATIFMGNFLIKYFFTDKKEKREFAILFINGIESHINILEKVFSQIDLPSARTDRIFTEGMEYIEVYKSNLIENKGYDIAFQKIGIFNENEIDLISRYDKNLKESLFHINTFCCTISGDTEAYLENIGKVKYKNVTKTENRNLISSFTSIKILVPITIILGYLCIYQLSLNYSQQYSAEYREKFLKECDCLRILFLDSRIFPKYEFPHRKFPTIKIEFHILDIITSDRVIGTLSYIRERYRKIDKAKDINNRQPIYLFRILINSYISFTAILKNSDKQTRINIISSKETFTNLTPEIPDTTFVTHAKKMLKSYIKEKLKNKLEEIHEIKYLFLGSTFKEKISEEDINRLEEYLDEDIDKFIGDCECESYIISPWGIDIDSVKMKFSQI
ncbi:hypothetical protein [Dapis sp. BLCC M229]|uniref:hypothetical protein n=1 Tax=Dapis sp. BLCC M229 TaxID=3400188 RepID=UPI003CF28DEB